VKHWHGAQNNSWFQHLSIFKEGATTEWLEPVNEAEYAKLK
jgi:quercetin dioxygenase-like cupin family protein